MSGFDLASVLQAVSDSDTEERLVKLDLDLIDPDPENFYSLDGIDELAGNIELVGLQQPLRVRPGENGRFTVVSGHRRRAACILIRDGGSGQFRDGVPCIVEYGEASDAMRKLRLIYANSSTRQLSPAEQSKQAEEVTRILYELAEQGVHFPGRMRDHVAEACRLSKTKIARLHAIRANLKPELLNLFDKGVLNESAAYELQRLPMDVQRYLAGKKKIAEGRVNGNGLRHCAERCESYLNPSCKCPDGSACGHTLPRFYQTATTSWGDCMGGCCLKCHRSESDCPYRCRLAKEATEARRAKDREEKEKEERREQTRRDANRRKKSAQYKALAALAKSAGLKGQTVINIPDCYTVADLEKRAADPSAINDYDARDADVFDKYCYVGTIRSFADKVGVSVDSLLGRETQPPKPAAVWQTGTPTRKGWCAVRMKLRGQLLDQPRVLWWGDGGWSMAGSGAKIDDAYTVAAWLALPKEVET